MKFEIQNIPFVEYTRKELKKLEDFDARRVHDPKKYNNVFQPSVTFVSIHALKAKAKVTKKEKVFENWMAPLIFTHLPAFLSSHWLNKFQTGESIKFSTGIFKQANTLLFVDDLDEWTQGRVKAEKVRTAWDIIWEMSRKI